MPAPPAFEMASAVTSALACVALTVLATSQRADGWCTSLRVLVHMASTPLLGALADRHGRVRIVVLSVALVTAR